MPKSKKLTVEVLPPEPESSALVTPEQRLEQLIEAKVAEVFASQEDRLLQPFFQPRAIAEAIRREQTVPEQRKWAAYHARFGCLRCSNKNVEHHGTGMCHRCRMTITGRLARIVKRLQKDRSGGMP